MSWLQAISNHHADHTVTACHMNPIRPHTYPVTAIQHIAPGWCGSKIKDVIFKLILQIDMLSIFHEIACK